MPKKVLAKILGKEEIVKDIFKIKIESKEIANEAKAGQFLEIKIADSEPFLRRPISIYNIDKNQGIVEFIFQVKGNGTHLLAEKFNIGDCLDIMGPLGKGIFTVKEYKNVAVIGGGIGIFPLYELTKELKDKASVNVYLGFRNKDLVTNEKEFEALGLNKLVITTDDGSYKEKGFAIDFMKQDIKEHMVDKIFACGPTPMLKAIYNYAIENNIDCELSLEERMGCGIGACLGCATKVKDKDGNIIYKHVCKDGPVFNASKIVM